MSQQNYCDLETENSTGIGGKILCSCLPLSVGYSKMLSLSVILQDQLQIFVFVIEGMLNLFLNSGRTGMSLFTDGL